MKSLQATFFLVLLTIVCCNAEQVQTNLIVKQNETFKILLPSNPSTGYCWVLVKEKMLSLVDSVSQNFTQDLQGVIGSSGREVWEFKAAQKGKVTLKFNYVRPWEQKKVVQTKEFVVTIND